VTVDTAGVAKALQQRITKLGGHASIAATDRVSGVSVSVRGTTAYQCASIIKVSIVAGLMMKRQNAGELLSAAERQLAKLAIEQSDNGTASQLFQLLGGVDGLAWAASRLGATGTRPAASWGMTTTTADDQVAVLKAVSQTDGLLSRTHQNLLLGWMANVIASQDFGVPAAASDDATAVYVKDGWFDRDDQGGLWQVNTIGRIVSPSADWVIACLSDRNSTTEAGIAVVEELVVAAHNMLTRAP